MSHQWFYATLKFMIW